MRLRRITLQHFRNVAFADLEFTGDRQFFVGANAQGKSNLLEAAGFISALRSFRTADNRALITHDQPGAALACELEHERFGDTRVLIKLYPGGKDVTCDGERIPRLTDYLGRFPTVVFSSQDQLLVRGAPGGRRRWLDLALAATDAAYLRALQEHHHALTGRNRLLKTGASPGELAAFEQPLATASAALVIARTAGIKTLSTFVTAAHARVCTGTDSSPSATIPEPAGLTYAPDSALTDAAAWKALFLRNRPRELLMKTTLTGPHRDDCDLTIAGRSAREFASEGQQRSLALALRLAEVEYLHARTGVQPVLLIDDVLGELDPVRRRHFWTGLNAGRQIIATGTTLPEADPGTWQIFNVTAGTFTP